MPSAEDASRGIRPLRSFALGALVGASLVVAEGMAGPWLPPRLLPTIALFGALLVGLCWALLEATCGLLAPRFRPAGREYGLALLTAVFVAVSWRLDGGGRNVDHLAFQFEFGAMFLTACGLWFATRGVAARWRVATAAGVLGAALLPSLSLRAALPGAGLPLADATDVVVVLVDTLRPDRLSLFGAERPTSPRLEALARDSRVYERAWVPSPWTAPSVASIFTGLPPSRHGLIRLREAFPDRPQSLAEHFRALGRRTFGSSGNALIGAHHGFARGFQEFRAPPRARFQRTRVGFLAQKVCAALGASEVSRFVASVEAAFLPEGEFLYARSANRIVGDFEEFLENGDGAYFAYLHLMEPHDPYDAPPPHRGRFAPLGERGQDPPKPEPEAPIPGGVASPAAWASVFLDRYDEEVLAVDAAIGEILEIVKRHGRYERTIIAVVSDHGEEFADRGGWRHGHHPFEEAASALYLLRVPGEGRQRSELPVSLTRLGRELSTVAGLPDFPGPELDAPIVIENWPRFAGDASSFPIVEWPWKLTLWRRGDVSREWLFDLERDPRERSPVESRPDVTSRLREALFASIGSAPAAAPEAADATGSLRALGYLQ